MNIKKLKMSKPKVYDCFIFFNELDLLEIRLNIMNQFVDYFVIVESNKTFSGKDKSFILEENMHRFSSFKDKIIYKKIEDTPEDFVNIKSCFDEKNYKFDNPKELEVIKNIASYIENTTYWPRNETQWGREIFQRECMLRCLTNCDDNDIVMLSDLDEIPNLNICNFEDILLDLPITSKQHMFYYFLNYRLDEIWIGTKICRYRYLKKDFVNEVRRLRETEYSLPNLGWHFSFLGGIEKIKQKIEAFSHQEYNNDSIKSNIEENVKSGNDIFGRGKSVRKVEVDDSFPLFLIENKTKYNKFFI
jgi:beta-1,4-mannosyl-glycoprotein beta-1,4-N-acetylglucosaminyltransferase